MASRQSSVCAREGAWGGHPGTVNALHAGPGGCACSRGGAACFGAVPHDSRERRFFLFHVTKDELSATWGRSVSPPARRPLRGRPRLRFPRSGANPTASGQFSPRQRASHAPPLGGSGRVLGRPTHAAGGAGDASVRRQGPQPRLPLRGMTGLPYADDEQHSRALRLGWPSPRV